jgi:hypothetical protein
MSMIDRLIKRLRHFGISEKSKALYNYLKIIAEWVLFVFEFFKGVKTPKGDFIQKRFNILRVLCGYVFRKFKEILIS